MLYVRRTAGVRTAYLEDDMTNDTAPRPAAVPALAFTIDNEDDGGPTVYLSAWMSELPGAPFPGVLVAQGLDVEGLSEQPLHFTATHADRNPDGDVDVLYMQAPGYCMALWND